MCKPLRARYVLTATLMFGAVSPALTEAATAPDSTLFTTYTAATDLQSANWVVCGSTAQSGGCYASGNLGPFGHIGAMLEGQPVVSGNSVTRGTALSVSTNELTMYCRRLDRPTASPSGIATATATP